MRASADEELPAGFAERQEPSSRRCVRRMTICNPTAGKTMKHTRKTAGVFTQLHNKEQKTKEDLGERHSVIKIDMPFANSYFLLSAQAMSME